MKIKTSSQQGGAAIAERLRLDVPTGGTVARPVNKKATMVAFYFALAALAAAGTLTYLLWQHWEYLMPT